MIVSKLEVSITDEESILVVGIHRLYKPNSKSNYK